MATIKYKNNIPDIDYYCDDDYIDCDSLILCKERFYGKEFIPFSIRIDGQDLIIEFEINWLFENIKDIGYGCIEDFEHFHWFTDVEELYERCRENKNIYRLKGDI